MTEPASDRADLIVAAAAEVMGRQGYAATSMKDIARAAGIAQGLAYYYFQSKEDLLVAVVAEVRRGIFDEVRRAVDEAGPDPLRKIRACADVTQRLCGERPELYRLHFELVLLGLANPQLRTRVQGLYDALTDLTVEVVESVLGELPARPPVPVRDFASALVASIDGIALRALAEPGYDNDALYRALRFMWLSTALASYVAAGVRPPLEQLLQAFVDSPAVAGGA